MWIGVISDTGGVLSPRVSDVFHGVDYILHCGGIGDPAVLDSLSHIAPVAGVLGPQDSQEVYPFGRILYRKWHETGILVTNRIGDPMNLQGTIKKDIETHDPRVVLFGGTADAFNGRVDHRLFVCPGSAGGRKTRVPKSIAMIELDGVSVRAEIILLDNG
jgi:putative phosphoesterase